jgi:uncharacterized protein YndB with AHSA1/START domain
MIDFTIDTSINRPISDVFAYVSDPGKLASWQTNTVSAIQETDGPFGPGTRLREVHRAPGGKELQSLVEVSECTPPTALALQVIEGTPIHLRITLEPTTDGTLLHLRPHGQLSGAMRLAQPLLSLTLKRQFAQHCTALKTVLEQTHQT